MVRDLAVVLPDRGVKVHQVALALPDVQVRQQVVADLVPRLAVASTQVLPPWVPPVAEAPVVRQVVGVVQAVAVAPVHADPPRVPLVAQVALRVVVASPSGQSVKSSTTWKRRRLAACASARATVKPFAWLAVRH